MRFGCSPLRWRKYSGQNPAEIPFQQPTNFRPSLNAKAAQKIGVVLPQTLVSANEVIE